MEHLENILLTKFGNRTPFGVPNGYFEQFGGNMMRAIAAQSPARARVLEIRRWWFSAAAAVAILFSVGAFSFHSYQNWQHVQNQDNYAIYLMAQTDDNSLLEYYFSADEE